MPEKHKRGHPEAQSLMRKFLIILLLVVCAYALFLRARPAVEKFLATQTPKILSSTLNPREEISKPPFDYGERFIYSYSMGPLKAGSAELTFVGEATIEGKRAFLVRFESRVGTFYDMEDIYAETENFYPIYVERDIKNFGVGTNIKEAYDQLNYKVKITKQGLIGKKTRIIKKKAPIHNAILLMYYCRSLPLSELKPGYEFDVVLPLDEFKVTLAKIEKIKVPAGTFDAFFFKSSPKKMRLWIATDEKRTPLKMENLTSLGPSSIILEKQITKD